MDPFSPWISGSEPLISLYFFANNLFFSQVIKPPKIIYLPLIRISFRSVKECISWPIKIFWRKRIESSSFKSLVIKFIASIRYVIFNTSFHKLVWTNLKTRYHYGVSSILLECGSSIVYSVGMMSNQHCLCSEGNLSVNDFKQQLENPLKIEPSEILGPR